MQGSNHAIDPALQGFVSRLDNLTNDRDALNADFKEVYEEAKEAGYKTLEDYRSKLGGLADMPLGEAAMARRNGRDTAA